ncbi:hypothetical protein Dsin_009317 [Dipteronia sinensis]|uniref:RNase H type-1 domain-containing protein n=1 Tax=Dipteronia sinensis TaxID=43782 RepID=A0AAE0EC02_9ROSI|nr:hypothetical protein Dsin_009317 [Dipteronia sinensis]
MLKSVQFSVDCSLAPCVFEMDEAMVVKWITDNRCNFSKNGVILEDIKSLSSDLRDVNFVYTSKKANGVAHSLAKHALQITEDTFWMEDVPACISVLVVVDKPG